MVNLRDVKRGTWGHIELILQNGSKPTKQEIAYALENDDTAPPPRVREFLRNYFLGKEQIGRGKKRHFKATGGAFERLCIQSEVNEELNRIEEEGDQKLTHQSKTEKALERVAEQHAISARTAKRRYYNES